MNQKIPPLASKQLEPLLISIGDIRPHPDNYKIHPPEQLRSLKASLKTFSWTTPIKANLEGFIIAGHGMYQAALEEGYTHVPVEFCALDSQLSKAYLVADNETARRAVTDDDSLSILLEGISEIPDFDIEAVGFSEEDIDTLLKSGEPVEVGEDEFNSEEVGEGRCKEGDLWALGSHRLLCGDSTIKENVERLMDGVKADMVFTDPPYGMNLDTDFSGMESKPFKGKNGGTCHKKVIGDDQPFDISVFNWIDTKEQFWWGADYYAKTLIDGGSWFVWDKRLDESADKMWGSCFEICWSKTQHKKDIVRVKWAGIFGMEKQDTDKRVHPTQKPIELCSWFISKYSKVNNSVLDLFLGSGSTLIACEQLNRTCYGMELDPHYCDVILQRWEQFTNQTAKKLS